MRFWLEVAFLFCGCGQLRVTLSAELATLSGSGLVLRMAHKHWVRCRQSRMVSDRSSAFEVSVPLIHVDLIYGTRSIARFKINAQLRGSAVIAWVEPARRVVSHFALLVFPS